jgi:hypothetical protein
MIIGVKAVCVSLEREALSGEEEEEEEPYVYVCVSV